MWGLRYSEQCCWNFCLWGFNNLPLGKQFPVFWRQCNPPKTSATTHPMTQHHIQETWIFKLRFKWFHFSTVYSCHGRWEDNGTHYLITTPLSRSSRGPRRYCFMYREAQDGVVHFSSSSDSCRRNISPGIGGAMAFNVTSTGKGLSRDALLLLEPLVLWNLIYFQMYTTKLRFLINSVEKSPSWEAKSLSVGQETPNIS
jgi:hypothetical protein